MDKELLLYNYFANSLSKEQEELFNKLLISDKDFKAQFDFENDLKQAIKDKENHELKSKLIGFEKEIQKEAPVATSKKSYRYLAIAASITMLIGLAWMGYKDGSASYYEDLYAANFQEYPNTAFTITRGDTNESLEREAFVAYESKNYAEAVNKFEQISPENKQPYVDFYLAQSFLNLKKNDKAKELLQSVIANKDALVAESHWYLALIAIKEKEVETAKAELKLLTKEFDFNKEKATQLLDKLN